jgi:predicted Kef-type K+ transport protein
VGVILLLFAIGLQFSVRVLLRAGAVATAGDLAQVAARAGGGGTR